MGRVGCFYCKKCIGKFQYSFIGLCNPCRRKLALRVGRKVSSVSLELARIDRAFGRNATAAERLALETTPEAPE